MTSTASSALVVAAAALASGEVVAAILPHAATLPSKLKPVLFKKNHPNSQNVTRNEFPQDIV
ncbi:hypothetical protein [Nioella sp. MMSF_3534]|uniref:hypothetical protein n=1 Tax=Nioella sp. MMSF_3534 TaxID=3046720 RepID=UPI00273F410B|nr:hypothetical protein [Nioella sp. MMSF_3534]